MLDVCGRRCQQLHKNPDYSRLALCLRNAIYHQPHPDFIPFLHLDLDYTYGPYRC